MCGFQRTRRPKRQLQHAAERQRIHLQCTGDTAIAAIAERARDLVSGAGSTDCPQRKTIAIGLNGGAHIERQNDRKSGISEPQRTQQRREIGARDLQRARRARRLQRLGDIAIEIEVCAGDRR